MRTLPTTLEGITEGWLTEALGRNFPGTKVKSVAIESVIWGTATKVFLEVDYSKRDDDGPPESLCVKGGFNDEMRSIAGLGYRIESKFYRDIAPTFGGSVPKCWYADESESQNQGIVITDDLRTAGARFGRPQDHHDVDRVAASLELLAGWHGQTWNRKGVGSVSWLTVGSMLFRPVARSFLESQHWADYMTRPQTASFDEALRDRLRVERCIERLWQLDDAAVLSVSHGDPHVGNTYSLDDGVMRFLDWQTTSLAPWIDDVAYFIGGVLEVDDRRSHEVELLRHYLAALSASGASAPTFDEAWFAYRRHHLHGLMFALCPPEMQTAEVCALMGDRYGTAAIDHETLKAFED